MGDVLVQNIEGPIDRAAVLAATTAVRPQLFLKRRNVARILIPANAPCPESLLKVAMGTIMVPIERRLTLIGRHEVHFELQEAIEQ